MNATQSSFISGRRRRLFARLLGVCVTGAMLASAIGATDLDALTEALQVVSDRYALPGITHHAAKVDDAFLALAVDHSEPTPATRTPLVALPLTVPQSAGGSILSSVQPITSIRPLGVPTSPIQMLSTGTDPETEAGPNDAARQYHLPTPVTLRDREDSASARPAFRRAVESSDGRAVELVDASPGRPITLTPNPLTSRHPEVPRRLATPLTIAEPTTVVPPALGEGRVLLGETPMVDGAARDPIERSPMYVPPDGFDVDYLDSLPPSDLPWEFVLNNGTADLPGSTEGGRNVEDADWTPGEGPIQDVIVLPDGSIIVVPEPTTLIALPIAAILLRRRRRV